MKRVIGTVTFLVMVTATSLQAASPKTEKAWNKCRERVEATVNFEKVGAAGLDAAISKKCGKQPSVKTKRGTTSRQNDCEWLYRQPLVECTDIMGEGGCSEGVAGLSVSSQEGIKVISEKAKVFKYDEFNKLCMQVCKTQRMPSRKDFGKMVCE